MWLSSKITKFYVYASTTLASVMLLIICSVLIVEAYPALVSGTLFAGQWNPAEHLFSVFPMIFGTIVVTIVAVLLAVPIGFFTAVFLSEMVSKRWRIPLKSALEVLAGIPSIVYGLIGVAVLAPFVGNVFALSTGRTLFTASLLLAIMTLPIVITMCDDALQHIPRSYREMAYGLGMTRSEVIWRALVPIGRSGLVSAVLLALGRAIGETMAVMLVVGGIDRIPNPVFNVFVPAQTLTSKLGREIAESAFGSLHFSALVALGLFLLIIVLAVTYLAQHLGKEVQLHE